MVKIQKRKTVKPIVTVVGEQFIHVLDLHGSPAFRRKKKDYIAVSERKIVVVGEHERKR